MKTINLSKINYFGNYSEIVGGARFDGYDEIPIIEAPEKIVIPSGITPFSQRHRAPSYDEAIGFFEYDEKFIEILFDPLSYVEELKKFSAVISPDFSLQIDGPIHDQIENINRNRAIGYLWQREGVNVIPLVRWGSSETIYSNKNNDRISFLGVTKKSIIAIGTYGCSQGKLNKNYLRTGLREMLNYLEPTVVLVYGPMSNDVFDEFKDRTVFIPYKNWIARMHDGDAYGKDK